MTRTGQKKKASTTKERYLLYQPPRPVSESFKGEVIPDEVKFPRDLGEKQPHNMKMLEGLYLNFGMVTGVVDKYVDFLSGRGFHVHSKDKKSEKIIQDWIKETNFLNVMRDWFRDAILKGNGYLELDLSGDSIQGVQTLLPESIYIKRSPGTSKVIAYNQFFGNLGRWTDIKDKVTRLDPKTIVHLPFNKIGSTPYGYGLIHPAIPIINRLIGAEKDMHQILSRKANSPLHITLGDLDKEDIPTQEDITNYGSKLEYMNNKQEWTTGPNVKMDVIDFGVVSDKFSGVLDHDEDHLIFAFQTPEVVLGRGNIPEGLADKQEEMFKLRCESLQAGAEFIIINQVFKKVLNNQKMDADMDIRWGQPTANERYDRITKLTELLKVPGLDSAVTIALQVDLVENLGLEGVDLDQAAMLQRQKDAEQNQPQPAVPGQEPQPAQPGKQQPKGNQPASTQAPKEKVMGELLWH